MTVDDVAGAGDAQRLVEVLRLALLDTPAEEAFDRLTRLAATVLQAPVSLVTLVDADRQFFKSAHGLAEPFATQRETPLSHSFCRHTLTTRRPLVIADARDHPLVQESPAIVDLGAVAYAGIPLIPSDGHVIGCLCVIDHVPREWTDRDLAILTDLAALVLTEMEARLTARRAEEARARARAAEETLVSVLEQLPVGIVVVDAGGAPALINGAALRILQAGESEDAIRAVRPVLEPALTGTGTVDREIALSGSDGDRSWVRSGAVPLESDGHVVGALATVVDITEERREEDQRDDFLSSVAHDLKGPLTGMKGYTQLLQRRLRDRETVETEPLRVPLEQIASTVGRMVALIDELQDTTRIHLGVALQLRRQPVDLVALVRRLAGHIAEVDERHEIVVQAPDEALVGDWDPLRLDRVVSNLLSNAVKYSSPESEVRVTVAAEEREGRNGAILRVSDRGIGIPARDLPHIFRRYYRASNTDHTVAGTGIGLVGVQQIVEQHGGRVDVESTEGEGSTFTVWLPLRV